MSGTHTSETDQPNALIEARVANIMHEPNEFPIRLGNYFESDASLEVYVAIRDRIKEDVRANMAGEDLPLRETRPLLSVATDPDQCFSIMRITPLAAERTIEEPICLSQYRFVLPRAVYEELTDRCQNSGIGYDKAMNYPADPNCEVNKYIATCPIHAVIEASNGCAKRKDAWKQERSTMANPEGVMLGTHLSSARAAFEPTVGGSRKSFMETLREKGKEGVPLHFSR